MSIIGNKKTKVTDEIPSSSMADIAFLLLIFFLITTVFPKDKGLELSLPEEAEEQEVSPKNLLFFLVQEDGSIRLKRGESTNEQPLRPEAVAATWTQEVAQNANLIASVQTHPDAPYSAMIAVLDGLKEANAERISLSLMEQ